MIRPPRWWSVTIISIVSAGVIFIGVGIIIESQPAQFVPASKSSSASVIISPDKQHPSSHGPIPSSIDQYTGPTNPPLQHLFAPSPSPSLITQKRKPRPTITPTRTITPTPTTLPPTPTPTIMNTSTPEPTDTSIPFGTGTASP